MAETPLLMMLRDYRREIEEHLAALRERHEELHTAWIRLREIYQGEGAEVFSEAFEIASRRLEDYSARGVDIAHQLERKIDELSRFQAPGAAI